MSRKSFEKKGPFKARPFSRGPSQSRDDDRSNSRDGFRKDSRPFQRSSDESRGPASRGPYQKDSYNKPREFVRDQPRGAPARFQKDSYKPEFKRDDNSGSAFPKRGFDRETFTTPKPFQRDGPRGESRGYQKDSFNKPAFKRDDRTASAAPIRSFQKEGFKPRYSSQEAPRPRENQDAYDRKNFDKNVMTETRLKGIFEMKNHIHTINLAPGNAVYGERLISFNGVEYRQWDPTRSKLGAAIRKGVSQIGIKAGITVLYLGCSTGTTVSHVSDIIGESGTVYALDVAPRVMRDLMFVCEKRKNILPIMADASRPTTFCQMVPQVDVIFMDIAQQNQVGIFLDNCKTFLKPGGFGLLSYKSRSVDISKKPSELYEMAKQELEKNITIVDFRTLEPFEMDHAFFVCKRT